MENQIDNFINEGYKLLAFKRGIDNDTGEEIGMIEIKSLDGHKQNITFDDNACDEIEKVLFKYLKNEFEGKHDTPQIKV